MANSRIIEFYSGAQPDYRGRYLREMQRWPDDRLETVHDFVQGGMAVTGIECGANLRPVNNAECVQQCDRL